MANKTLNKTGNDISKDDIQFTLGQDAKQLIHEPQSVTTVIVTTNGKGVLQFDTDYELANNKCLSGKCILEYLPNRPDYNLVNNVFKRPLKL